MSRTRLAAAAALLLLLRLLHHPLRAAGRCRARRAARAVAPRLLRRRRDGQAQRGPGRSLPERGRLGRERGDLRSNAAIQLVTRAPRRVLAGALALLHAPIWEPSTVRVVCAQGRRRRARRDPREEAQDRAPAPLAARRRRREDGPAPRRGARRRAAQAGGLSVMAESDIAALLGMEKTKEMLGCTDAGCIAEVGGALGVDRVIHGSIGRVGSSLLVNISSLDPRRPPTPPRSRSGSRGRPTRGSSTRCRGSWTS